MRTTQDLRAAFADIADTAPDPDVLTIPTSGTQVAGPKRGRRVLVPVAAAVLTATAVAGVAIATSRSRPDRDDRAGVGSANTLLPVLRAPEAHGSPDRTFRFTASTPVGTVVSRGIDRGGQVLRFSKAPTGRPCANLIACNLHRRVAQVTLYWVHPAPDPDEKSSSPGDLTARHPARVDGRPGWFGRPGTDSYDRSERLVWEYAPGAWAEVIAATRADMLALAATVRPATEPVQVPVDPARFSVDEYLNLVESERSAAGGDLELTTRNARNGGFLIRWGTGESMAGGTGHMKASGQAHPVTIRGRAWTITNDNGQPEAVLDNSAVPLTVTGYLGMTTGDLQRFITHLRLAPDLADRSTWFTAAQALP